MSTRRGTGSSGRSSRRRRDRYGIEDEEKYDGAGGYSSSNGLLAAANGTAAGAVDPVLPTPAAKSQSNKGGNVSTLYRGAGNFETDGNANADGDDDDDDDEGNEYEPLSPTRGGGNNQNDIFRDEEAEDDDQSYEEDYEITLQELLYSTSAFYAICVPVTITMILSALAVVYVNNEETLEDGAAAMNAAYAYFDTSSDSLSTFQSIALGLANGLIMVTVIGAMTFVIVLLYKYNCMWCLIGYMMFASTSLLGFLGGHLWWVAIQIYQLPVDWLTYTLFLWNFASVGVLSIFYGKGVPKYLPQGYLICTSVILAWHLSYFDDVMAWTLLFMLALYDLCAVLTPCGPLKALVNLMSQDDAPEMPGLLYEAELPPEARRPGGGARNSSNNRNSAGGESQTSNSDANDKASQPSDPVSDARSDAEGPRLIVPLAVARVYNLPVIDIPAASRTTLSAPGRRSSQSTNRPLLEDTFDGIVVPEDPTRVQLQADVIVQLPVHGGRIEKVRRNGRVMYLERDRHGSPKRVLWVDRQGRVFAESSDFGEGEDSEGSGNNSIRLGLGDFIFYSVLVAKAAEYSFTTFMACMLVILAGLGGTLVLLSVFHHALPALPISICLGIFFYIVTRVFIEPWIEAILIKPFYV